MSYFLYILHSNKIDRYYIGISQNPEIRLEYHNKGKKGWTTRGVPWHLMFKKQFNTKAEAVDWERWLKKQKDRSLIERILRNNFDWKAKE